MNPRSTVKTRAARPVQTTPKPNQPCEQSSHNDRRPRTKPTNDVHQKNYHRKTATTISRRQHLSNENASVTCRPPEKKGPRCPSTAGYHQLTGYKSMQSPPGARATASRHASRRSKTLRRSKFRHHLIDGKNDGLSFTRNRSYKGTPAIFLSPRSAPMVRAPAGG